MVKATPSLELVQQLCEQPENRQKNLIPVCLDVVADLDTPVSAFLKLQSEQCFLLESVTLGENLSRYSFIGIDPVKTIRTGDGFEYSGDPLTIIEHEMKQYRAIQVPSVPLPLTGGAVGYCSFDAVQHFEPKVAPFIRNQKDVLKIPESVYMFFEKIVVFDHAFHTIKLVVHCHLDTGNLAQAYDECIAELVAIRDRLSEPLKVPSRDAAPSSVHFESNVGQEGYMNFVTKLKDDSFLGSKDILVS